MISTTRTHRRAGYATIVGPAGRAQEIDTATCKHCCRVWPVRATDPNQKTSLGGWCRSCMAMICDACVGRPCKTIEQRLAEMEARERFERALDGVI
jgi:hypothetical protein